MQPAESKSQVKTKEFGIPLPERPVENRGDFNDPGSSIPPAFKQQVIKRFGGVTHYVNFKSILPNNSSFYFQKQLGASKEMNRT